MKYIFPALLASALAIPIHAQTPPKCPDTHFPCGGDICCSK